MKTLLALFLISNIALADCTSALSACKDYSSLVKSENEVLKEKITIITRQRDESIKELQKATTPPLIPWWGYVIIGAGVGIGTYTLLRK